MDDLLDLAKQAQRVLEPKDVITTEDMGRFVEMLDLQELGGKKGFYKSIQFENSKCSWDRLIIEWNLDECGYMWGLDRRWEHAHMVGTHWCCKNGGDYLQIFKTDGGVKRSIMRYLDYKWNG